MVVAKRVVRRRPAEDVDDEAPVTRTPVVEDDEEEEEAPAPRRPGGNKPGKPAGKKPNVRSGWTGSEQVIDSTSSFAQAFKLDETAQIIAFLEEKPYAGYARHWIERANTDAKGKKGKTNRPYTCLTSVGMGECPVCDVGDKPQAVSSFNIALIGDDGVPTLKSWDAGAKLFRLFKQYHNDPKVGPLTKGFYLVSRSGSGGSTNYQVNPVRRTSLMEDYNVEPPTQEELDDVEVVSIPTRKEMNEIAAELADYDEYDD
jgi:hypothetical protein